MPHRVTAKMRMTVTLDECLSHVPGMPLLERAMVKTVAAGLPVALKGLLSETSTPGKVAEFSCRVTNIRIEVTEHETEKEAQKDAT